jgi:hypothetical protein
MYGMKKLITLWHVAGPVMCVLLVVCGMELGPAWSAHLGHGQRGTWTVTQVLCSGKGCNDLGTFVSANGSDIRVGIGISRGSSLGVGRSLPAIDTGGDVVYPAGGGPDWLIFTIMPPLLILLCAVWTWTVPLAMMRRRRAERQSPLAEREQSGRGLQTFTGAHQGHISGRHARK